MKNKDAKWAVTKRSDVPPWKKDGIDCNKLTPVEPERLACRKRYSDTWFEGCPTGTVSSRVMVELNLHHRDHPRYRYLYAFGCWLPGENVVRLDGVNMCFPPSQISAWCEQPNSPQKDEKGQANTCEHGILKTCCELCRKPKPQAPCWLCGKFHHDCRLLPEPPVAKSDEHQWSDEHCLICKAADWMDTPCFTRDQLVTALVEAKNKLKELEKTQPTLVMDLGVAQTNLATLQKEKDCLEIVLDAWHKQFGTSQLSHASARLQQAESDLVRAHAKISDLEARTPDQSLFELINTELIRLEDDCRGSVNAHGVNMAREAIKSLKAKITP